MGGWCRPRDAGLIRRWSMRWCCRWGRCEGCAEFVFAALDQAVGGRAVVEDIAVKEPTVDAVGEAEADFGAGVEAAEELAEGVGADACGVAEIGADGVVVRGFDVAVAETAFRVPDVEPPFA